MGDAVESGCKIYTPVQNIQCILYTPVQFKGVLQCMMEGGDGVLIATDRCTPGGQPTLSTSLMMTIIQHDFDQGEGT